jgi:hypothetical protein
MPSCVTSCVARAGACVEPHQGRPWGNARRRGPTPCRATPRAPWRAGIRGSCRR